MLDLRAHSVAFLMVGFPLPWFGSTNPTARIENGIGLAHPLPLCLVRMTITLAKYFGVQPGV